MHFSITCSFFLTVCLGALSIASSEIYTRMYTNCVHLCYVYVYVYIVDTQCHISLMHTNCLCVFLIYLFDWLTHNGTLASGIPNNDLTVYTYAMLTTSAATICPINMEGFMNLHVFLTQGLC